MGNSESSPSTPSRSKEKEKDARAGSDAQNIPTSQRKNIHTPKTYTPTPPQLASSASTSTSNEQAQASHSRSRSQTSPSTAGAMGNAESKQKVPSRATTLDTPSSTSSSSETRQRSPLSQAIDVPQPSTIHEGYSANEDNDLTPPTSPPFGMPASVFNNPPRLPLPIERDPEPSSPIISPADVSAPPLENESDDAELPKSTSLLSQTTLGDDEEEEGAADIQQFAMETDSLAPKVPITLTWRGEGRSIYVTGTFASWEKKFRMHRSSTGVFTTTIPLTPGTHHITFLVDGDPKTSRDLPTTVDFANALVNYIEVIAPPQSPTSEKGPTAAVQIPGTTTSPTRTATSGPSLVDDQPLAGPPRTSDGVAGSINETVAPATNLALRPHSLPTQAAAAPPVNQQAGVQQGGQVEAKTQPAPPKKRIPRPKYTSEIPEVLINLDLYNKLEDGILKPNDLPPIAPNDDRYRRASRAIQHLPQPPSLPMFMSKSILNATTPQKDDASVLTIPNHTVLNHLATSSIRQGVLATSGTTRYKRKFLTTIMYKPTSDDG